MKTFTELLDEYIDATKDDSTANRNRAKRRINARHQRLCTKDYWWLYQEFSLLSTEDGQIYDLPAKFKKFKELVITVGDLSYPLSPYHSLNEFDKANMWGGISVTDYVEGYQIRDDKLYLVPPTANANILLTGVYLRTPYKMVLEDVTSPGTISVTNGSKTITGSSTTFNTSKIKKGMGIIIDDEGYEIASVTSETELILSKKYEGPTASGIGYKAGDISLLPEGFEDLLWLEEAMMYFISKDKDQYIKYKAEAEQLKKELDSYASGQIVENVKSLRRRKYFTNPNFNPRNIG